MADILEKKSKESGFILVASLLVLLILVIIGVAATNSTIIELQIAGNDKVHKQTFYQADGGAELGIRLTYENALCINFNGFTADSPPAGTTKQIVGTSGNIVVEDLDYASSLKVAFVAPPTDTSRDAVFYTDPTDVTAPHTNISAGGLTRNSEGSGLQMIAGYEGLGKGSAAGGTHINYTIIADHEGVQNSESVVAVEWKLSTHLINNASSSDCEKSF